MALVFSLNAVCAHQDTIQKERLWSGSTKGALLDTNSHDSYVINACRSQALIVQFGWKDPKHSSTELIVTKSPDFFERKERELAATSKRAGSSTYEIDKTGNYYIYVTGMPRVETSAPCPDDPKRNCETVHRVEYSLRVKLKGRGDCTSSIPSRTEGRPEPSEPER